MDLWSWREGVALLARPGPPGLLLLWLPALPSSLQPFILGSELPQPLALPSHYPSLCLQLVSLWNQACMQERWLEKWLMWRWVEMELTVIL
jgi:hypothetical protein